MRKIAILTNIIPPYRKGFYSRLFEDKTVLVKVYCQKNIKGASIQTIHELFPNNVQIVPAFDFPRQSFSIHALPIFKILSSYDIVFVDGNPRNISHFISATLLYILNKKVVLWSQVHSYRNNVKLEMIRQRWMKLFKNHLLYNDKDIITLQNKGFTSHNLHAMNNGLDQEEIETFKAKWTEERLSEWQVTNELTSANIIISSGRLINNKYDELLNQLTLLASKLDDFKWICIGDGPDRKNISQRISSLGLKDNVLLLGAVFEEEVLTPYFLSAKIFVHPTAVGLSINHAFAYGLPIITHDDFEKHGPEIVAFENDGNGITYSQRRPDDLATKIVSLLKDKQGLVRMKSKALSTVRNKYNTTIMYQRFINTVNSLF